MSPREEHPIEIGQSVSPQQQVGESTDQIGQSQCGQAMQEKQCMQSGQQVNSTQHEGKRNVVGDEERGRLEGAMMDAI